MYVIKTNILGKTLIFYYGNLLKKFSQHPKFLKTVFAMFRVIEFQKSFISVTHCIITKSVIIIYVLLFIHIGPDT